MHHVYWKTMNKRLKPLLTVISVPSVRSIASQDEKNQLLTTCMWFNLVWTDYQLSWNTSEYGGVDSVVIQPRNLWIPDILLYNRSVLRAAVSTAICKTLL